MKEIKLAKGAHPAPFDESGAATMCVQEYVSYLAGEPHSDSPKCVSPMLTAFMVAFNDALDDETRQRLRPYAVRQIGTKGDGQDEVRSYIALDWIIRTCTPAFLAAAGLTEEADKLRGLATIKGLEQAQAAGLHVNAAEAAARAAARAATRAATRAAAWAAAWDAAWAAARAATRAAARAAAWAATGAAVRDAAWDAAEAAIEAAVWNAARDTLESTVKMLQESAFTLLDQMIDPAGLHDTEDEAEVLSRCGREPLVSS